MSRTVTLFLNFSGRYFSFVLFCVSLCFRTNRFNRKRSSKKNNLAPKEKRVTFEEVECLDSGHPFCITSVGTGSRSSVLPTPTPPVGNEKEVEDGGLPPWALVPAG